MSCKRALNFTYEKHFTKTISQWNFQEKHFTKTIRKQWLVYKFTDLS